MFGLNLQQYIEDNINFKNQGSRPNQDIYYNIEDDRFWIHSYFGNEPLSPNTERENICIHMIKNYDDFEFSCSMCYGGGSNGKHGYKCAEWQECQAQQTYEFIQEHKYDDLWGGNGIYHQIMEHLDNCHISELAEIRQLLEYHYGEYHKWMQEQFNSNFESNVYDYIIDNIIDDGFGDGVDDGWLDGDCQNLVMSYEHINDEKLQKVLELLGYCKIIEALELLKGDD